MHISILMPSNWRHASLYLTNGCHIYVGRRNIEYNHFRNTNFPILKTVQMNVYTYAITLFTATKSNTSQINFSIRKISYL